MLEVAYDKCIGDWDGPDIDKEGLVNAVVYIFNGALGIINYWVKNDFNTPSEELARYIENYTINGARKYIPKRNIIKEN